MVAAIVAMGCALFTSSAWAQVDLDAVRNALNTKWRQSMPNLPEVTQVHTTPIAGLYEVVAGGEVIYTDLNGDYILLGELLDIKSQRSLTQDRAATLIAQIDFDKLPLDQAIVIQRGDGSRKLAIFEDPNCGYCHKFERDLVNVDNVTVYVFLYPILAQSSHTLSRDIWCAEDPAAAWQNWMIREIKPAEAQCDVTAINNNVALGQSYSIKGTPTLVFTDGSRIPGAVPVETVEARFAEIKANSQ